ncbi:MAG: hypothetical protein LBG22_03480 [Treponema sp.]|jgi:hypothetical protein|nr:hypothetical protein [Treponema sp.]
MAGLASSMYTAFSEKLKAAPEAEDKEGLVDSLMTEMRKKEKYPGEMRKVLTSFPITCNKEQINPHSSRRFPIPVICF